VPTVIENSAITGNNIASAANNHSEETRRN